MASNPTTGAQAQAAVASTSVESTTDKPKKNKPKASQLRQQKLPAWQPILTATTVIPTVLLVGIVFIPIGVILHLASESVRQHVIDYTDCGINSVCRYSFTLSEEFSGDVFFYYALENYYQNHRRYVKSRNDQQLLGNLDQTSECEPYAVDNSTSQKIAPCGAVANSMFNDTFELTSTTNPFPVPMTTEGVLWSVDANKKFKNPAIPAGGTLCDAFKGYAKPPNWQKLPCEMGGFENPDFIVWMRTAALPNFRKLWRILARNTTTYLNGLPAGTYTLSVTNNYPVSSFSGRKSFIISTTSWAGGKNSFLGIAYLVVGCLAIVLAVVFLIIHYKWKEMSNLNNVQSHQG